MSLYARKPTPTEQTYIGLDGAYDFFNDRLFGGSLPPCLITMQRKKGSYGYFAGERFGTKDGVDKTDEIALNPSHFRERSAEEVLSTLVHEMAHLWQHHCGKPSRSSYHNKEWAAKMEEIGLMPSSTGAEGGKRTGQRVSHYILEGGPFAKACEQVMANGFALPYVELWTEAGKAKRKRSKASKTKYTCPACALNVWGKPDIKVVCGECMEVMEADSPEDDG